MIVKTTPGTVKALRIIRDNHVYSPDRFAHLMWPESRYWEVRYKCGNGSHAGRGVVLSAGSFLARLRKQGLIMYLDMIKYPAEYELTPLGKEYLKAAAGRE